MRQKLTRRLGRLRKLAGSQEGSNAAQLVRGSFWGLASRLASVCITFFFGVFVARALGAADSGIFYLALSIVSSLAVATRLGIDGAVIRVTAHRANEGNWSAVKSVYGSCAAVVMGVSAVVAALLWVWADTVAADVLGKEDLLVPLRYLALALPPLALIGLQARFLRAVGRVASALYARSALVPTVVIVVMVVGVSWLPGRDGFVLGYAIATYLALFVIAAWWLLKTPVLRAKRGRGELSDILRSGRTLFLPSLADQILQPWAAIIILGMWGSAEEIGWFSAASRMANIVAFMALPVTAMLSSKAAVLAKSGDLEQIGHLSRVSTLLIIAVALPVAAIFSLFPAPLMAVFGTEFAAGAAFLVVLALAQFLGAIGSPARTVLLMSGEDRLYRNSSLIGGLCNVAACLVLIPLYGGIGAAWSVAIGLASVNVFAALTVWLKFGIDPLGLSVLRRFLRPSR